MMAEQRSLRMLIVPDPQSLALSVRAISTVSAIAAMARSSASVVRPSVNHYRKTNCSVMNEAPSREH
jgi:hypothetical protein